MKEKLLIIGIDPGATVGYSILGLDGSLVELKSCRNLKISNLIFELMHHGRVVVVGCDVNPPPHYVKEVARRLGAGLIVPEASLTIKEKRKLTKDEDELIANKHEKDALAASVYAFKRVRPLLNKIDVMMEKKYNPDISSDVKKMLLTKRGLTIERAVKKIKKGDFF